MTSKTIKTIMFASLIAAMILPFSSMNIAEAQSSELNQKTIDDRFAQVTNVYDDEKLNQVTETISKLGVTESSKIRDNEDKIMEKTVVSKHGKDSYKVTYIKKAVTKGNENHDFKVTYFVTPNEDGSLYVNVPDASPSAKSNIDNSNGLEYTLRSEAGSPVPVADATSGTKKFTMEVSKTINNNFVDGSDTFVQNCGMLPSTSASMYGAADANTIGDYWRAVNANMGGAYFYGDWCIFVYDYEGVDFEMGGSSYNDHNWKTTWAYPGWGPTGGLDYPWDDLHWKTNAYYN